MPSWCHKYAEGASNEEDHGPARHQSPPVLPRAAARLRGSGHPPLERRLSRSDEEDLGQQTLSEELEQLGLQPGPLCMSTVLGQAVAAVRSLTDSCGVALSLPAARPAQAFADEALTRQLLVSLLSGLAQAAPGSYLELEVNDEERWVDLRISGLPPTLGSEALEAALGVPRQLALEWAAGSTWPTGTRDALTLSLPSAREDHVVIVDDNPKTLRLFQRYLEPHRFQVTAIQDSSQALGEIRRLQPDVVLLDDDARCGRLADPSDPQDRPRNPPHPGDRVFGAGGRSPGPDHRRRRLPPQAHHPVGTGAGSDTGPPGVRCRAGMACSTVSSQRVISSALKCSPRRTTISPWPRAATSRVKL